MKTQRKTKDQTKTAIVAARTSGSAAASGRLKPERVQDGLSVRKALQRLRVMERLDRMPGWKLTLDSRAIGKVRAFDDPQDAAAYAAFAIQLAAGRRQALQIAHSPGRLAVTLRGTRGITGPLLALAAELG